MVSTAADATVARQMRLIRAALSLSRRQDWTLTARQMQALVAREAMAGLVAMLDEQGIPSGAQGKVSVAPMIGRTGGGIPIGQALEHSPTQMQRDRLLMTVLQDTARQAVASGIAARPQVSGYVRILEGGSCARCVVLAGRFYKWNAGFQRHPKCFPAGAIVSGPGIEAATRRQYEGELARIATESGELLSLTGNHPVLTDRGWVPAHFVNEGDKVFRSTSPEGALALMVPDHHQVPASVEDLWSALGVGGFVSVPTSTEDFHGDGQAGEVDIVLADGSLWLGGESALFEKFREPSLAGAVDLGGRFDPKRPSLELDFGGALAAHGFMGCLGLCESLIGRHLSGASSSRVTPPPDDYARSAQALPDVLAANAIRLGEGEDARSALIGLDNSVELGGHPGPRWDAPGATFSMESRGGYASRGLDLLNRLAGQVEADRVVDVSRVEFRGHVYSVQSAEGWHVANNLIVSNCDCRHMPTNSPDKAPDPREVFDGLSVDEQDRRFGQAGAEAIRAGADISRVVNARSGIETAQMLGRDMKVTTVGTGRRKLYSGFGPRLMPESILAIAKDRQQAIDLLAAYGYIT